MFLLALNKPLGQVTSLRKYDTNKDKMLSEAEFDAMASWVKEGMDGCIHAGMDGKCQEQDVNVLCLFE